MSGKLVEYLATTRLGERGTMTLPKEYRDALRLKKGASMAILRIGDGLMLIPEQERFEQLCDAIASRLENAGISDADLQSTLPEVREQLARRHYPDLFVKTGTNSRAKAKPSVRKSKGKR